MKIALRELAHARAGDKGDTSNIAVFATSAENYARIKEALTPDFVREALAGVALGNVRRYEVDSLMALNFVLERALEGGVNASLNLDSHGKSWSSLLLGVEIEL
jgi:hypothetical protein